LFVRDLGSLNGTYVNSQKIDSEHWLQPDQLLTLGTVTFRAIYQLSEGGDNGHAKPASDSIGASVNPPEPASADPPSTPVPFPAPTSEADTERDNLASDTDTNLPTPQSLDLTGLSRIGEPQPEVGSSIFIEDAQKANDGAVSLSAIAKLPGGAAPLSFAGGVQLEDNTTTQPAPVAHSLPKIDTGEGRKEPNDKQRRRRPR
jgi:hypothetical protein